MDDNKIKDVLKEENTRCEIYTFYKNEYCDTPTRVLLYIALSGFAIVGFLIICFLIASCLRFKRYKEKREMELITPVSSELRLKECVNKKYPKYSRKNSNQHQDYHQSTNYHSNNNNNNNNGNTGIIEEEYKYNYDYSQPITNTNTNNNGNTNININISRDDTPIPVHHIRERNKEMQVERFNENLNSLYQSSNYKKLYPNLSYGSNIDQVNNSDNIYNSQVSSYHNEHYNLDEPYYYNDNNNNNNNNRKKSLTNVEYYNSRQYYDESIDYDNKEDTYENNINSSRNKIKNVAYPMNNNKNYYRESYEKYTSNGRKNDKINSNNNNNNYNIDKYNGKISIQINQSPNKNNNEKNNRNQTNRYENNNTSNNNNNNNNDNKNNSDMIYSKRNTNNYEEKNKKIQNNSNSKKNKKIRGDDSNDTLNKNNIKEIYKNGSDSTIYMKDCQKIYPQEEINTIEGQKEEKKVEVSKKHNVSSHHDHNIIYFDNQDCVNNTNQEEYIHQNINHNRNSKMDQQEMKMVCTVNRTSIKTKMDTISPNIKSNSINSDNDNYISNTTIKKDNHDDDRDKKTNKVNNIQNIEKNEITLDQVKNLTRPVLQLQHQQSPPSPPLIESEKNKKTKSVNFAPLNYKSNLIRNLNSISPSNKVGGQRKISEIKLRNYRPRKEEPNNNKSNSNSDNNSNDYNTVTKEKSSSRKISEIEFERIDSFEEVQRSINTCENEQIKNQQYLNYMNNINANLNLPSIPVSNSLSIEENLNEMKKRKNEMGEEEVNAVKSSGKEKGILKRPKSAKNSSKKKSEGISNENQLQRKIMNNPMVQNSSPISNSHQKNYLEMNPNSTQNFPITPNANYTCHQITDNCSVKQVPISSICNNYFSSTHPTDSDNHYINNNNNNNNSINIYPDINIDEEQEPADKVFVLQNRYRNHSPLPQSIEDDYTNQSCPISSYTNNMPPTMMLYDIEDNNDYSDDIPQRRMISSAENNIPGPPPTASSSYIPHHNNNNSRPVSQSIHPNSYYFNDDLNNNGNPNGPDYPIHFSYQSPTYYDDSQNQIYLNNMVIPFQKPKVCVREAPILKHSNTNY
ncbi:hypothetical protein BCR36DRAFT_363708 [Piromyces finnis]|uniref:Uncharacterized protein n=1 Tax=Piromyces finnis TaxID=1754191 RepID=A0A1Y1UUW9_9FUNG|nr:hypothetical protein BCR36DRAFT_363708 [Piromyces finnis]|eukprot:ORX41754.1 hypothetical protein BCR36DRAFT_363708 [Piromyces finnis]